MSAINPISSKVRTEHLVLEYIGQNWFLAKSNNIDNSKLKITVKAYNSGKI